MKWVCWILVLCLLCGGCADTEGELNRVLHLRASLQEKGCKFNAVITADYADHTYTFVMSCSTDASGHLSFEVLHPESIAGISGTIGSDGGKLTFDDVALSFSMLADGQITPVSAPWILVKTLLGGYISASTMEGQMLHVTANDSYFEDALQLDIWLDSTNCPVNADIVYRDRRILSLRIENFEFL